MLEKAILIWLIINAFILLGVFGKLDEMVKVLNELKEVVHTIIGGEQDL